MSLLAQIQANEIINLRVSDTDDELLDNAHKFIAALKQNHTLESIHFENEFLGCIRNDARSELLRSLGQVTSLQQVHMAGACVLVSDIALLLMQAKSLRVLKMNKLVLQGVADDFNACEMALFQHGCMREFEMEQCFPAMKEVSLDKLEKAGRKLVSATASGSAPTTQLQNLTSARTAEAKSLVSVSLPRHRFYIYFIILMLYRKHRLVGGGIVVA
jgi:hypothetical protein